MQTKQLEGEPHGRPTRHNDNVPFAMWLSTAVGTTTSPGSKYKKARLERAGLFYVYRKVKIHSRYYSHSLHHFRSVGWVSRNPRIRLAAHLCMVNIVFLYMRTLVRTTFCCVVLRLLIPESCMRDERFLEKWNTCHYIVPPLLCSVNWGSRSPRLKHAI